MFHWQTFIGIIKFLAQKTKGKCSLDFCTRFFGGDVAHSALLSFVHCFRRVNIVLCVCFNIVLYGIIWIRWPRNEYVKFMFKCKINLIKQNTNPTKIFISLEANIIIIKTKSNKLKFDRKSFEDKWIHGKWITISMWKKLKLALTAA